MKYRCTRFFESEMPLEMWTYKELAALRPIQKHNLQLTSGVFCFTFTRKLIGESIRQTLAGNFT